VDAGPGIQRPGWGGGRGGRAALRGGIGVGGARRPAGRGTGRQCRRQRRAGQGNPRARPRRRLAEEHGEGCRLPKGMGGLRAARGGAGGRKGQGKERGACLRQATRAEPGAHGAAQPTEARGGHARCLRVRAAWRALLRRPVSTRAGPRSAAAQGDPPVLKARRSKPRSNPRKVRYRQKPANRGPLARWRRAATAPRAVSAAAAAASASAAELAGRAAPLAAAAAAHPGVPGVPAAACKVGRGLGRLGLARARSGAGGTARSRTFLHCGTAAAAAAVLLQPRTVHSPLPQYCPALQQTPAQTGPLQQTPLLQVCPA
jgi:hypothetical protein